MMPLTLGQLRAALGLAELLPQSDAGAGVTAVSGDEVTGCVRVADCYIKFAPCTMQCVERLQRSYAVSVALFDRAKALLTPKPLQLLLGEKSVAFATAAWPGVRASQALREQSERRLTIWRQLGAALAVVHAHSRDLSFTPYGESLEAQFATMAEEVAPGSYAASVLPQLRGPLLDLFTADDRRAFVHGDCSLHNWIWDPALGPGAIDFDLATRGDPHFDFAVLFKPEPDRALLAGPAEIESFEVGYGVQINRRWLPLYQALHYLLVLHTFGPRGPDAGLPEAGRRKISERYRGFLRQLLEAECPS